MIGKRIKMIRVSKGITGTYVAKRLGVHQTTYSKYESDDRRIDANMLPDLAEILGVPIGYFFDDRQDVMSHNSA